MYNADFWFKNVEMLRGPQPMYDQMGKVHFLALLIMRDHLNTWGSMRTRDNYGNSS